MRLESTVIVFVAVFTWWSVGALAQRSAASLEHARRRHVPAEVRGQLAGCWELHRGLRVVLQRVGNDGLRAVVTRSGPHSRRRRIRTAARYYPSDGWLYFTVPGRRHRAFAGVRMEEGRLRVRFYYRRHRAGRRRVVAGSATVATRCTGR